MTTVEDVKKRGPERHLTNNYNFAGPGTFYAARMKGSDFYENLMKEAGKKVVGTKPYNVPINKLDSCAKTHDKVYNNPNATGDQVQESDRVFQDCIGKIKPSDGIEQKLLSIAAKKGFDAKLLAENVGVVRKGSFASGGDKHSVLGQKVKGVVGLGKKATGTVSKTVKKIF
jgi:hypothetical protein|tara:strand:+ start:1055 stop:1567 length:513 start_codon:yes stop_codon:yes gene_type:complete